MRKLIIAFLVCGVLAACDTDIPAPPRITVVITAIENEAALEDAVNDALTATSEFSVPITQTALALEGVTLTPTRTPTATETPLPPTATRFLTATATPTATATSTPTYLPYPTNTALPAVNNNASIAVPQIAADSTDAVEPVEPSAQVSTSTTTRSAPTVTATEASPSMEATEAVNAPPAISVSSATVASGDTITVQGIGFSVVNPYEIWVGISKVADGTSDDTGRFDVEITIPQDVAGSVIVLWACTNCADTARETAALRLDLSASGGDRS